MNSMKRKFYFVTLLLLALIIAACSNDGTSHDSSAGDGEAASDSGDKIVIGFAHAQFDDKFMGYLKDGVEEYEESLDNVEVIYVDAMGDPAEQLSQVENFVQQQVDAIIILPVDTVSPPTMIERSLEADIPIVVVNREYDGVDAATAYVGGDSLESGVLQMEQVAKLLGGEGNVAIMNGEMGHDAQIKRTEGNMQVIEEHPDIEVVLEGTADWDRARGMDLMENWLQSGEEIDAVVANNDEMAIGAILAAEAAGVADDIIFAGIDATIDALEYVENDQLAVTVFQDPWGQGSGALEAAIKAVNDEPLEKLIYIPYELVTKENMDEYVKKWE